MTYAPSTHRIRQQYTGPRRHEITVTTREPGVDVRRQVSGGDPEVIAWLRALADELERGTVTA